ncbi:MAG: hypothetical protein KF785_09450 [Gemmatimonadales bacterium]|nr:hypothetical protein [Gemmatimonadales bacterium]
MHLLFKFPTDATFYDLAQAARKMRISVAELGEMAHAPGVDFDVVGWTCHKGHDGAWQLRLLGQFDFSANKSADLGWPTDAEINLEVERARQAPRRPKRST